MPLSLLVWFPIDVRPASVQCSRDCADDARSVHTSPTLHILMPESVYALYDRSFTTGILLMTLFIAEFGVMTVVWALVIRSFQFGPTCLLAKTPWMIGFMKYPLPLICHSFALTYAPLRSTVVLVIQAIVWGMTAWKSSNYGGKGGKGICLVRIAHRDGAAAWIAMTGMSFPGFRLISDNIITAVQSFSLSSHRILTS
jgi:hypothetical protein